MKSKTTVMSIEKQLVAAGFSKQKGEFVRGEQRVFVADGRVYAKEGDKTKLVPPDAWAKKGKKAEKPLASAVTPETDAPDESPETDAPDESPETEAPKAKRGRPKK